MTEKLQGIDYQKKLLDEIIDLKNNIERTNHHTISQIVQCKEDKAKLQGITETVKADDFRFKIQDLSDEEYEIRVKIRKELNIK